MPTTALKAARAASAAPTGEDRSSPGSHDERHDREGAPLVPWDFICRKKDRIRQRAGEAVERGGPASPVFEVEFPNAGMAPVTVGAFETLEIPLLKGRYFDRSDTPESSPVAIVNNSLARATWPNEDPIGKQIRLGYPSNPYGPWRTIVGIVGDVKQHGVDQETPRQLYMPITQQPRTEAFAVARTRFAVPDSTLKAAIDALDRSIPAYNDRTVDQVMHEAASRRRIAMIVLSVFGAAAVLLAAIGLYGVIAQAVTERRQEIGIRMSLGASRPQVVRMFMLNGAFATAVGLAFGLGGAMTIARSLRSLVFGMTRRIL